MYSGSALLLDVHYPAAPNGYGIVFVPGNAWHEPLSFDAEPLKGAISDRAFMGADALLENGYTLFSINYRSAPGFRYPAAVEDAQRAVRYVRYHAALYGIDPNRIGVIGHSSGGHLASMLGVLDGDGDPEDLNPINQESSKVQAVVALAGAGDLTAFATGTDGVRTAVSSFIGTYLAFFRTPDAQRKELSLYAEASPTSYISPDEITIPSGDHFLASSESDVNIPDYIAAMVEWFDRFLVDQE
jgi:acetyl esterase/lipase